MSQDRDALRLAGLDPASHVFVYPFKGRPAAVVVLAADAPRFVFSSPKGAEFVGRFVGLDHEGAQMLAALFCRWIPPCARAAVLAAACGDDLAGVHGEAVH